MNTPAHTTPPFPTTQDEIDAAVHTAEMLTRPSKLPAVIEVIAGAAAGAGIGSLAGPVGTVVGALIGGFSGGVAGHAIDEIERAKRDHDEQLDKDMGILGGDIGAASPNAPPSRIGAFSGASMGASGSDWAPSDGPIQNIDE